ncbi:MAG TPA: TIGR03435 family protein [Bryobacteraceae bacterium]|nr:TIGR03435 family protein [Bryobacteraceae bacterium]
MPAAIRFSFISLSLFAFLAVLGFAQTATTRPRFDVADIHRSALALNPYTYLSGGVLRGARYDLRKATMLDLVRIAYGVDPEAVYGGPNWLAFDRFDIAAKAPKLSSPETIRLMLQSLLSERFKLAVHKDTRPMPAFVLAMGRGTPKLKKSEGPDNPGECQYQPQPAPATFVVYSCRNIRMKTFAETLRGMAGDYLAEPVVDSTDLKGAWDFDLKWNARSQILPDGSPRTTIFDAVEKQLGLTLSLQKAPAAVLVIDHVNEQPTDNPPDAAQELPPRELQFEVASVRMSRPGEDGAFRVTPGGGLEAHGITMRVLFATAWDVDWTHVEQRIVGLPKWADSARFDIAAKASTATNSPPVLGPGMPDDDVRLMLRSLLIDRFGIKSHYENRLVDAYTLVSRSPKLKKADPNNRAGCREAPTIAHDPRDINPRLSQLIQCQNTSMAQFAELLQGVAPDYFAYNVEDATGISGAWDFTLSFTPTWMLRAATPQIGLSPVASGSAVEPTGTISLPEAINKELGLKLEMQKRKVQVLVIDHINEKPADN